MPLLLTVEMKVTGRGMTPSLIKGLSIIIILLILWGVKSTPIF
jgi:hypothetical protein